jgi:hypothetical protein
VSFLIAGQTINVALKDSAKDLLARGELHESIQANIDQ